MMMTMNNSCFAGANVRNQMLSYRRQTALQGALVLAKSVRLQLEDNTLRTLGL